MDGINNISNITADSNHVNKQSGAKKSTIDEKANRLSSGKPLSRGEDQAQISPAAKELLNLKTETKKYIQTIQSAQTTSEKEISELKTKIQDETYFSPEIIDAIVEKLINMPNFFDK